MFIHGQRTGKERRTHGVLEANLTSFTIFRTVCPEFGDSCFSCSWNIHYSVFNNTNLVVKKKYLCDYLFICWLCWVLVATCKLSLVAARGLLSTLVSLDGEQRLWAAGSAVPTGGFQRRLWIAVRGPGLRCWPELPWGVWGLPGPGTESVVPESGADSSLLGTREAHRVFCRYFTVKVFMKMTAS